MTEYYSLAFPFNHLKTLKKKIPRAGRPAGMMELAAPGLEL